MGQQNKGTQQKLAIEKIVLDTESNLPNINDPILLSISEKLVEQFESPEELMQFLVCGLHKVAGMELEMKYSESSCASEYLTFMMEHFVLPWIKGAKIIDFITAGVADVYENGGYEGFKDFIYELSKSFLYNAHSSYICELDLRGITFLWGIADSLKIYHELKTESKKAA